MSKQHVRKGRAAKQRRRIVAFNNLIEHQGWLAEEIRQKEEKLNSGSYKQAVAYIRNARKRAVAEENLREEMEYLLEIHQRSLSIARREIDILGTRVR